jgi:hypothetical protein
MGQLKRSHSACNKPNSGTADATKWWMMNAGVTISSELQKPFKLLQLEKFLG